MKNFLTLICCFFIVLQIEAQSSQRINTDIAVIPQPVELIQTEGYFLLPSKIIIDSESQFALKRIHDILKNRFSVSTGKQILISGNADNPTINLQLNEIENSLLGNEGYQLKVDSGGIIIKANKPAGLFYGVQTLFQLLPKEIESSVKTSNVKWEIPFVQITDYPRFKWRGLMMDVARHFFTVDEVKQYIDEMVRYKYNLLHLHLTDNEGWRIEIKRLPKLTEVGAWNVKKVGFFGRFSPPEPNENRNYGGFFTQEDIKELVQYAKANFVDILPEIDLPGHALAAVAAYPELSCTPGAENYKVGSGEDLMDRSSGKKIPRLDWTVCPAKEEVYVFAETVISQIADLFPFEYIHMGGDEVPKQFWEQSEAIKNLMKKERLQTMEDVQSYFQKRVAKIVESHGKKYMGWDEIVHGEVPPDASVISWRGTEGGIKASKMNLNVVMAPFPFTYFNQTQSDPVIESPVFPTIRLNKVYSYEPIPEGANPEFIMGAQGCLWSEQIYNMRTLQYQTWPRGMALAEVVWSPKEKKNWSDFVKRTEAHLKRLKKAEINFSPGMYDPICVGEKNSDGSLIIKLSTEIEGLDMYYSFNNSIPDRFYPKYSKPLSPPKDATTLRVITYRGKEPIGRLMVMPIEELEKRLDLPWWMH